MNLLNIAQYRLISQQIAINKLKTPADIANYMGAMQAQDYNMCKWALGIRLPGSTDNIIEKAFNSGEILRTHLLRPTWHLVSAENIHWMLELTAPHVKSSIKARHTALQLTPDILSKCYKIIEKSLNGGKHLTREELMTELVKAKIDTDNQLTAHIMLRAELEGLVCSGVIQGKEQTYALLDERVPKTKSFTRDEALAKLAHIYFTSHGPATIYDFIWWSGLPAKDARHATEMIKPNFNLHKVEKDTYWLPSSFNGQSIDNNSTFLIPAFDEYIISYRDRSAFFPDGNNSDAISSNGIFKPVVVVNGQAAGTWKRTIKKSTVTIEPFYFNKPDKAIKNNIEKAATNYGNFLNCKTEIIHS